jgi:hypothetical protein
MSRYLLISLVLLIFQVHIQILNAHYYLPVTNCILSSIAHCNRLLLPIAPFRLHFTHHLETIVDSLLSPNPNFLALFYL